MANKNATIHDIARELDVTASTVSRALNDHPRISEKTKELVRKTAQRLNYNPNVVASTLRTGRTKTIGLVVPRINRDFFSTNIYAIESISSPAGYNIIICQSNESFEKEVQNLETLVSSRVEGIIISVSYETNTSEHLQKVKDRGIPIVQFDRIREDFDSNIVVNDDEQGAYDAVSHLIDNGYRRIALFTGSKSISIYKNRMDGYLNALRDHDIVIDEGLIFNNVLTKEKGVSVTRSIFANVNTPDAIFALSDFSALGAYTVLKEKNIAVPQDIGIIGYANEPFTELIHPGGISSVDQHSEEIGKTAATILLENIDFGKYFHKKRVRIIPNLIIRDSSNRKITTTLKA